MPIINNINVNKDLGLVVWRGDLITIDWNEYDMLDQ
jgi:hypothetical protein